MINIQLAVIGIGLWTVVVVAVAAVGAYLFLRNNPNKKAKIDEFAAKAKDRLNKID